MNPKAITEKLNKMSQAIAQVVSPFTFSILEVGALPLKGTMAEPFHILLDIFPGSKVTAFEVDGSLCETLNASARPEIRYHPVALGINDATCTFYETAHPMCCSLYKPNETLLSKYHNLGVAMLKSVSTISTTSLDSFSDANNINDIDFIKIDIQGAELDVFKGGGKSLKNTVAIVSEVGFIPLYEGQPLFGDVCNFLGKQGFMFHKFLGIAGRTLKPTIIDNNLNHPSQHMWSDAVFIRDIQTISNLSANKLLKMGILAFLYGSPDVAYSCFSIFDEKMSANLSGKFLEK